MSDADRLADLYCAEGNVCSAADLRAWLERGGALLVEREDGSVLAAVKWRPAQDGWVVERVWTRSEERGNGFGRWLMTKLEALAIRGNIPSLELELDETADVGYYRRMGYRPSEAAPLRLSKRVGGVWQRQAR